MFYSKATGGFYDTAIHGVNMPADAIEVTAAEHAALLDAQSQGSQIQADADGRPVVVVPPLTVEQAAANLKNACEQAIRAGLVSSALGVPHRYDTDKDRDQYNLIAAGHAGRSMLYTCTDLATGTKARRTHTAAQMAQVLDEGIATQEAYIERLYSRLAALDAATTPEEIAAVVW